MPDQAPAAAAQPVAVEELVQQLSLLRSVADSVPVLVAYVDATHRFQYNNRRYQTWFGVDPESLAGEHVRDIDGDDAYEVARPYMERASSGEFLTYEARMPFRHGGARDVEVTYVPDGGPLPSGFFAIVSDVSEEKAAARAARENIQALIRIVEAAPAMSYVFGTAGNIEYATPVWEQFYGVSAEDAQDWESAALVHPDDVERCVSIVTKSLRTGDPFEAEFRGRRHDGEYRWIFCRAVPIAGPSGGVERWVAIDIDIHDRKLLEDERERVMAELERSLMETEQARTHLDALLRITPVGIVFVDREMHFIRVNETAAEINGLPIEAHIGTRLLDLLPGLEEPATLLQRVLDTGEIIPDVEVSGQTPREPGVLHYWLASYYPVPALDGSIAGAGVVFREITEQRRHEQERERLLEELGAANAAKDEFLGLVSHELKTPITTILGNAQILRTKGARLDEESRSTALQDIESEAHRLHRIIENLLVLARLERGHELVIEPVFVRRVLGDTIDEFARKTHRTINLAAPDDYAFVLADPVYIRQVVENLLSNAHKYSPPGEPIGVRVNREDDELCVRVIDHGVGFTEEEAKMLFQPFYRSERTSRDVSGVGIGLAVCNRIIEALGGRMWASPGKDGGAEIGFALPLAEDEGLGE